MTKFASLVLFFLLAAFAVQAEPHRVVSTNLCADQLVLLLADRDQIVSLSRTAFEPPLSNVVARAKGIPANNQRAEEIVALKPDLVISSRYRELAVNAMLRKLGLKIATVPSPQSVGESYRVIRSLAGLLGHPARGEAMVADMEKRFKALDAGGGPRPRALVYQANGGTIGAKTLAGELMVRAGLYNLAGDLGVERWGSLSLEAVAVANPDIIILESDGQAGYSLAQMAQHHPVFRDLRARRLTVAVPSRYWVCPGPWNLDAVALLARARAAYLAAHKRKPLTAVPGS